MTTRSLKFPRPLSGYGPGGQGAGFFGAKTRCFRKLFLGSKSSTHCRKFKLQKSTFRVANELIFCDRTTCPPLTAYYVPHRKILNIKNDRTPCPSPPCILRTSQKNFEHKKFKNKIFFSYSYFSNSVTLVCLCKSNSLTSAERNPILSMKAGTASHFLGLNSKHHDKSGANA